MKKILIIFPILLFTSACNNNITINATTASSVTAPPASGTNTGDTNGGFSLSNVFLDAVNPTTTLDLIDSGSGAFGQACVASSSTSSSSSSTSSQSNVGASTCQCSYTYTDPSSGATNQQVVNTSYFENDMIECPYSGIPSGVSTVQVSVYLTTTGTYSNSVTFNLGGSGVILDFSNPANFSKVVRYQCRDIVTIPYLFDSTIYDPLQSENPHLSYPLNYYATNLGSALANYAISSATHNNWNCPPILNGGFYLDPFYYQTQYAPYNNLSMTLYSVAPLSGTNNSIIYTDNPSLGVNIGDTSRSEFFLANASSGVFNVPVDALLAPGIVTSVGSQTPPIGWGAAPVALSPTEETCETLGATIPPGYKWVKVWLFRASLTPRTFPVANPAVIACNPGDWPNTATSGNSSNAAPIFSSCPVEAFDSGVPANLYAGSNNNFYNTLSDALAGGSNFHYATSLNDVNDFNIFFADRIYGNSNSQNYVCSRLDNNTGALCGSTTPGGSDPNTYNNPGPSCISGTTDIGDQWQSWFIQPNQMNACVYTSNGSTGSFTGTLSSTDILSTFVTYQNSCSTGDAAGSKFPTNTTLFPNASTKAGSAATIMTGQAIAQYEMKTTTPSLPVTSTTNLDSGNSRYDFVFVVGPGDTSISLGQMQNITSGSTGLQYTPFRYYTDADCQSPDPNNPAPNTCSSQYAINTYGLKLHDINSNGDPPATDPNRAGVFPVCAIQPITTPQ